MNRKTLLRVGGNNVFLRDNRVIEFEAGMTIDADGSPRAYHPDDKLGLDYLANAGHPGNWWALVCENGRPIVQSATDPAPGYYVSTTAYFHAAYGEADPRRYLDSERVCFVVVPSQLRRLVKPIVLGCRAIVTNLANGKTAEATVGDIGPATHLGEGSIALAKALRIPSNPRRGGVSTGIRYEIFPGETLNGFDLLRA